MAKSVVNKMSLDAGMENVKCVLDGAKSSSLVAIAEKELFGSADFLAEHMTGYEYNGVKYEVATEYAKRESISNRDFKTYASLMPILIFKELEKAGVTPNADNKIIIKSFRTGVPLTQYPNRGILDDVLKVGKGFIVNGVNVVIENFINAVQGLVVITAIYGKKMPKGIVVVIEIGSKTVEIIALENGKIISDSRYSQSIDMGMNKAYLPLIDHFRKKLNKNISEPEMAEAFRKGFLEFRGQKIDIGAEIDAVTKSYTKKLMKELETVFSEAMNNAKHIIVCGGGAYNKTVINALKAEYSNIVTMDKDHEFANALGYDAL